MSKYMLFVCYRASTNLKLLYSPDDKRVNITYSSDNKQITFTYSLIFGQIKNKILLIIC